MNDHDWLATRYVLGELDSTDEAICESLLVSDQAFRESVAMSVELLAATQRGFQTEKPRQIRHRPRRLTFLTAGMAGGIAATVLLAVGWMGFDRFVLNPSGPTEVAMVAPPTDTSQGTDELDEVNLEVVRQWAHHQFEDEAPTSVEEDMFVSPVVEETTPPEGDDSSDWLNALAKIEPES